MSCGTMQCRGCGISVRKCQTKNGLCQSCQNKPNANSEDQGMHELHNTLGVDNEGRLQHIQSSQESMDEQELRN